MIRRMIIPLAFIISSFVLLVLIATSDAPAHYNPGTHNAVHAIQLAFCGKSNRECREGNEGISVAKCESSTYWYEGRPQEAKNGQYLGMFQMGKRERHTYGHGPDPWTQAYAARRYFMSSGRDWSPWECKP